MTGGQGVERKRVNGRKLSLHATIQKVLVKILTDDAMVQIIMEYVLFHVI